MLSACKKEKEKVDFINNVINNPDRLEEIIQKSIFKAEPFIEKYFYDDAVKGDYISKLNLNIDKFIKPEFTFYCNRERDELNGETGHVEHLHEIIISGSDENRMLIFQWRLEYGEWKLFDIFFSGKVYCK